MEKERVIVYIDGFNLYSGIKESGFRHLLWLNVVKLAEQLLKPRQELICVKYFTALITYNFSKREVQKLYLGALSTLENLAITRGEFIGGPKKCRASCGQEYTEYSEKMTDVNIATQLVSDAYTDAFDMAMLISGDTDLVPPISLIHNIFKNKRVMAAFPPGRKNDRVARAAKGSFVIGRKNLKDAQLKDTIIADDGTVYEKPKKWNSTRP